MTTSRALLAQIPEKYIGHDKRLDWSFFFDTTSPGYSWIANPANRESIANLGMLVSHFLPFRVEVRNVFINIPQSWYEDMMFGAWMFYITASEHPKGGVYCFEKELDAVNFKLAWGSEDDLSNDE